MARSLFQDLKTALTASVNCSITSSGKSAPVRWRTSGALLSPVRVQFTYEVVRPTDQVTLATGTTVHAALGRNGRPCRLPKRVQELFS